MSIVGNSEVVNLQGELNFVTVPALAKNQQKIILEKSSVVFDLSQVTLCDNTGVALLIYLASFAKSKHKKISFTNLPTQLLDLLEAVGVKDILPLM